MKYLVCLLLGLGVAELAAGSISDEVSPINRSRRLSPSEVLIELRQLEPTVRGYELDRVRALIARSTLSNENCYGEYQIILGSMIASYARQDSVNIHRYLRHIQVEQSKACVEFLSRLFEGELANGNTTTRATVALIADSVRAASPDVPDRLLYNVPYMSLTQGVARYIYDTVNGTQDFDLYEQRLADMVIEPCKEELSTSRSVLFLNLLPEDQAVTSLIEPSILRSIGNFNVCRRIVGESGPSFVATTKWAVKTICRLNLEGLF